MRDRGKNAATPPIPVHLSATDCQNLASRTSQYLGVVSSANGAIMAPLTGSSKSECMRFVHSCGDLDSLGCSDLLDRSGDLGGIIEL
jgi:hypothetical protein